MDGQAADRDQGIVLSGASFAIRGKAILSDLTLTLTERRIGIIGQNGSGKTTLLRLIAGLIAPTSGSVTVDGIDPARDRKAMLARIGILFQNPDRQILFPTVAEELAFGLSQQGHRDAEAKARAALAAEGRADWADLPTSTLSQGQRQWLCLQAVLLMAPRTILLDEPFAALDRNLRLDMQIEIKRLQRTLGLTTILVTHDQDEAMSVADRIAVMNKGRVEQFGTPVAIYDEPQTLFVNGFIGTTNLMNGTIASLQNGMATVTLDAGASVTLAAPNGLGLGAPVLMSVRPEQLALSAVPGPNAWKVEPGLALPIGAQLVHEARATDGTFLKIIEPRRAVSNDAARAYCTLANDARPTLFPRST